MRGKVAKRIRKLCFPGIFGFRFRRYQQIGPSIFADDRRDTFQKAKKAYVTK